MGFDTLSWAWKQKTKAKLVLIALAESANDESGECWPGLQLIAARCEMTIRSARRAVKQLSDDGLVRITPRYRTDGTQTSNTYHLCLPTLPDLSTYPDVDVRGTRTPTSSREPELEPSGNKNSKEQNSYKTARRSLAPAKLEITDPMRAWAKANYITGDLAVMTEAMLDHHRGKGNMQLDWVATWRTWMRNSKRFGSGPDGVNGHKHNEMCKEPGFCPVMRR